MVQIDRAYVALAIVLLILGEGLGLYMGIASDTKLRTMHVAMVLPGFATLAIYGCLFRLWPEMKKGALAAAQFWLGALSAIGIVIGSYQYVTSGAIYIVAPASAVALIAAALLLWLFCTRSAAA